LSILELISGSRYNEQVIADLIQINTNLESCSFYECRFEHCSFTETTFHKCRFVECFFNDCDLSLAEVPSSVLSGVHFDSSRLLGIDWTQADWNSTSLGRPIGFSKCNISHSTFIGLKLRQIKIVDTTAQNVDFREADFSQADFDGTDLADSVFSNTNLSKADLSSARNYTISSDKNTIKESKFSLPEAMSLLFRLDIVLVDYKFQKLAPENQAATYGTSRSYTQ